MHRLNQSAGSSHTGGLQESPARDRWLLRIGQANTPFGRSTCYEEHTTFFANGNQAHASCHMREDAIFQATPKYPKRPGFRIRLLRFHVLMLFSCVAIRNNTLNAHCAKPISVRVKLSALLGLPTLRYSFPTCLTRKAPYFGCLQ